MSTTLPVTLHRKPMRKLTITRSGGEGRRRWPGQACIEKKKKKEEETKAGSEHAAQRVAPTAPATTRNAPRMYQRPSSDTRSTWLVSTNSVSCLQLGSGNEFSSSSSCTRRPQLASPTRNVAKRIGVGRTALEKTWEAQVCDEHLVCSPCRRWLRHSRVLTRHQKHSSVQLMYSQ